MQDGSRLLVGRPWCTDFDRAETKGLLGEVAWQWWTFNGDGVSHLAVSLLAWDWDNGNTGVGVLLLDSGSSSSEALESFLCVPLIGHVLSLLLNILKSGLDLEITNPGEDPAQGKGPERSHPWRHGTAEVNKFLLEAELAAEAFVEFKLRRHD